jgi:hypothetical protein
MGPMSAATGAIKLALSMYEGETNTPGGLAPITYAAGAGAYTLATPVPGGPVPTGSAASLGATGLGGDDGKQITILSTTAQAHVITTAAGKVIGANGTAYGTITFAANIGCSIVLKAWNGLWYVVLSNGVTLS